MGQDQQLIQVAPDAFQLMGQLVHPRYHHKLVPHGSGPHIGAGTHHGYLRFLADAFVLLRREPDGNSFFFCAFHFVPPFVLKWVRASARFQVPADEVGQALCLPPQRGESPDRRKPAAFAGCL